jgi:hypothetical protein
VSTICLLALFEFASERLAYAAPDPQDQNQESEELEVRISPLKSVMVAGDILQLRVEIWNMSTQDLFICKQFDGIRLVFCNLELSFAPPSMASRTAWAADTFPDVLERGGRHELDRSPGRSSKEEVTLEVGGGGWQTLPRGTGLQ